jgi:peptidase E
VTVVCLQGGAEFGPSCREMDRRLLTYAADGPVVVVPLAGAPGREYDTAGANGARHFGALGAQVEVAPDARKDAAAGAESVRRAGLIVLPGGSPRRLLDALRASALDEVIADRLAAGVPLMGASAGAMVVCEWTVLPQWRGTPNVARGLGLVTGLLVIPHYDGKRSSWVNAARKVVPDDIDLVGLPECSGVLVDGDWIVAVGAQPSTLLTIEGATTLAM